MEHAVIKLGLLVKGEETVFRRFSWNDLQRDVSVLSQLHSTALSLHRGVTIEKANLAAQDYFVSLHYYDLDDDKVLIWTDSDVLNALKEYSTRGRVRIFAQVQEKQTKDETSTESTSTVKATQTTTVKTEEKASKTEEMNVVDAFADLLSIAVVSVEAGVNAARSKEQLQAARQASNDHLKAAKAAAKDSFKAAKAASRDSLKQARNSVHNVVKAGTDTFAAVASIAVHSECPKNGKSATSMAKEHVVPLEGVPFATPAVPELVFIHGRHTCDQCLTTPIVGKRFHATELPDYDLCEACYNNYKGSEIKFEEARLDRDVPFQERWNRKRAIQQVMKSSPIRHPLCGLHYGPPPRRNPYGPPHRGPHFRPGFHMHGVPPHMHGVPPPFGYPPHPPPPFHVHPSPHDSSMPPSHNPHIPCYTKDAAFEEAVRRSLQDVAVEEKGKEDLDSAEIADGPRTVAENVVVKSEDDETFSDCKEASEDDLDLHVVENPAADEDAAVVEDAKTEPIVVETVEAVMTGSVDTETIEEENSECVEMRAAKTEFVEVKTVEENNDGSAHSSKDDSFASDAAGSGDIAAFVGETLDRMGEAIEDLSNFNLGMFKAARPVGEVEDDGDSGSKIFGGEDDLISEGSWSVVVEEEHIGADEGLGRAAQAIGSALFNSDTRSSENVSALSHSIGESSSTSGSNVSSVTSVPTTVRSIGTTDVAQVQLERWAVQLEQLHELGFLNDALCVDVLESLAAANIGVDSEDEVSVQQVVEKLMNGW